MYLSTPLNTGLDSKENAETNTSSIAPCNLYLFSSLSKSQIYFIFKTQNRQKFEGGKALLSGHSFFSNPSGQVRVLACLCS